jgi:hypothetical protein
MSKVLTGTIEYKDMGSGAWALVADNGETYELRNTHEDLQQNGQKVKIEGKIRNDVMSFAMIGTVLEVTSFEVLE